MSLEREEKSYSTPASMEVERMERVLGSLRRSGLICISPDNRFKLTEVGREVALRAQVLHVYLNEELDDEGGAKDAGNGPSN